MKEKKIGEKLRKLRKEKDLTQEGLASDLGVSRQTINALESGKYLPSVLLALEMADFFNIALEDFFCEIKRKEDKMTNQLSPRSFFDDPFFSRRSEIISSPEVNVINKGGSVVIEAEIPGVDEKDLDIEVGENSVRISGQKQAEEEVKEKDYYYKESSYGSFQRVIPLPQVVKHEKATAEIMDGVLRITIPKAGAKKLSKTIKLKAKTSPERAKRAEGKSKPKKSVKIKK